MYQKVRLAAVVVRRVVVDYKGTDASAFSPVEERIFEAALEALLHGDSPSSSSSSSAAMGFYLRNPPYVLPGTVAVYSTPTDSPNASASSSPASSSSSPSSVQQRQRQLQGASSVVALQVTFELDIISESNDYAAVSANVTAALSSLFAVSNNNNDDDDVFREAVEAAAAAESLPVNTTTVGANGPKSAEILAFDAAVEAAGGHGSGAVGEVSYLDTILPTPFPTTPPSLPPTGLPSLPPSSAPSVLPSLQPTVRSSTFVRPSVTPLKN